MIKHERIKSENVCQLEIQIAALAELIMLKNLNPLSRMNIWNFLSLCFILVREYLKFALTLDKENL